MVHKYLEQLTYIGFFYVTMKKYFNSVREFNQPFRAWQADFIDHIHL